MARTRVLFALGISPNKIGGMEAFATELARQLKGKNRDLIMVFEAWPPELVRKFLVEPGNVTLQVQQNQTAMGFKENLHFLRLLLRHRPESVIYTLGGVVRWWPLLARLAGVKQTIYYDGTSRTKATINYRASAKVKLAMKPLGWEVCATNFVQSCSDREGIVPVTKRSVIYNPIEAGRSHGDGPEFRRRYGIAEDRIMVVKVSWLVPYKGIDVALKAASRALAVRQDLQFVFCGDGDHRAEYEQLAAELGISDHVTWTGQLQDLFGSGAYAAADLQIQCSQWYEACGLSVLEGMDAGLPVIASRIGGLPELVIPDETGLLVEAASDEEWAEAILRLAVDKPLRKRMGAAGRARALQKHDLILCVAEWVRLLVARRT